MNKNFRILNNNSNKNIVINIKNHYNKILITKIMDKNNKINLVKSIIKIYLKKNQYKKIKKSKKKI